MSDENKWKPEGEEEEEDDEVDDTVCWPSGGTQRKPLLISS